MRAILTAILILSTAAPAFAESRKQRIARCAAQADIVGQAVEMRQKRKSEKKVKAALAETVEAKYAPSIPMLVGWVYTLNRKDLTPEIKGEFQDQCAAYKP